MKMTENTWFIIKLEAAELHQLHDWLARLIALHPHSRNPENRPKIVDDLKDALHDYRHRF